MEFIRIGGLSPVKYKLSKDATKKFSDYHNPPRRRGIFAFIHPYKDHFLWAWKIRTKEGDSEEAWKKRFNTFLRNNCKIFNYDGWIWTHLDVPGRVTENAWTLIHTDDLGRTLNKTKSQDVGNCLNTLNDPRGFFGAGWPTPVDPYKHGLGGFISVDHLEVFIEGKYCGRIR